MKKLAMKQLKKLLPDELIVGIQTRAKKSKKLPNNIELQTEQIRTSDSIRRAIIQNKKEIFIIMCPMNELILVRRIIDTHSIEWKATKKYPAKSNGKKIL